MATPKNKNTDKELNNISKQSSIAIHGTTSVLDTEDLALRDIIRQTTQRTSQKYGIKTNNRPIDYFTEISMAAILSDATIDPKNKALKKQAAADPNAYLKKYMTENDLRENIDAALNDVGKIIEYQNYEAIEHHIPECSTALKVFTNNIVAPDDFTKKIFLYNYEGSADQDLINDVNKNIEFLVKRYKLESKTMEYISNTLLYGDYYVTVLSLEQELSSMLSDPLCNKSVLQENISMFDTEIINLSVSASDISLNESQAQAMNDFFGNDKVDKFNDKQLDALNEQVASFVNEHFVIDSKLSMLQERAEFEHNRLFGDTIADLDLNMPSDNKNSTKIDTKPLFVSGSAIRELAPERVIELKLDDIVYGYYYVEEQQYNNPAMMSQSGDYLAMTSKGGQTNGIAMTSQTGLSANGGDAATKSAEEAKTKLISDIFLNAICKKINKEYVRHNKQFKDFIYSIVRQKHLSEKQIRMTFFSPDEVIHFKTEPLYKNIVFFAKLYLAMLTNLIILNLGRGHDKRVFYVGTGLDEDYELAISKVIEKIKSKSIVGLGSDINTILSLNPGILDDYFIPVVNGERGIEIETLAGASDIDVKNDSFLTWLRNSIINGMNIPSNLIDSVNTDIDFARQISQQNSNFLRQIIAYQLQLSPAFQRMVQLLYFNEFRFNNDSESDLLKNVDINKITVNFPSPASLNMNNMQEQIQTAGALAEEISIGLLPPLSDASTDAARAYLKSEIFKDLCPFLDLEKYQKIIDEKIPAILARDNIKKKLESDDDQNNNDYYN